MWQAAACAKSTASFIRADKRAHLVPVLDFGRKIALRFPRPSQRGRNEWPATSAFPAFRFRRLTLRSATGTAQRARPYPEESQDTHRIK